MFVFFFPFKNQSFRNSSVRNQTNILGVADFIAPDVWTTPHKRELRNANESQAIDGNFKSFDPFIKITVSVFNLPLPRNIIEIPLHDRLLQISRKAA